MIGVHVKAKEQSQDGGCTDRWGPANKQTDRQASVQTSVAMPHVLQTCVVPA